MDSIRLFVRVEATAALSLLLASTVMAALGAALFLGSPGTAFQGSGDAAAFYFTSTFLFGVIPAVALGGPIYFFFLKQREPRWLYVILLGVTPGLLLFPFDVLLGTLAIVCGLLVASLTHLGCRRLGPNQSFKPTPSARLNSRC